MRTLCFALCIFATLFCQISRVHCCTDWQSSIGRLSRTVSVAPYSTYTQCWNIRVPSGRFIRLKIYSLRFYTKTCSRSNLKIIINGTERHTYCEPDVNKNPVTALTDVVVELRARNEDYSYRRDASFTVDYEIQDIQCGIKNSFHCTKDTCIPKAQVCDGVKNCENGADELKCETGVISVPGVEKARLEAITWLKNKRTPSWGWRENTARAVTALFLGGGAKFNGKDLTEELMAKETDLNIAVSILKDAVSIEEISSYINALLVTCHNPSHFHGQNLVERLQNQIYSSTNFTHPNAYLALCNANETWPDTAVEDLSSIFNSDSDYAFVTDMQAYAMMAVSCYANNTNFFQQGNKTIALFNDYQELVKRLKNHQLPDGSYGNIHTTALVTQALLSAGQEHARDWKLNATLKYLMKELSSSKAEVYGNCLTLPVLNAKSLSDIAKVKCAANSRMYTDDDVVNDAREYSGPKIRVQYSLFVGDEKDVVHTIYLRVPENSTAYEVMQLAKEEDEKYRFEWKKVSNKMYVYSIGKRINDPENRNFWLIYLGSKNCDHDLLQHTTSPEEIILEDNSHLVMWYKKAQV